MGRLRYVQLRQIHGGVEEIASPLQEAWRRGWEDGGIWAGVARPNTPNFPLNCVTPFNITLGKHHDAVRSASARCAMLV